MLHYCTMWYKNPCKVEPHLLTTAPGNDEFCESIYCCICFRIVVFGIIIIIIIIIATQIISDKAGQASWVYVDKKIKQQYQKRYRNSVNICTNLLFVSWQVYGNKITVNIYVWNVKFKAKI